MSCNGKIVSSETNSCDSVYVLRPGRELRIVDGKIPGNVYARLEGTEEDVAYEIVLSYPANRPAKYVLKTVDYVDDKIKDCVDREIVKEGKERFVGCWTRKNYNSSDPPIRTFTFKYFPVLYVLNSKN